MAIGAEIPRSEAFDRVLANLEYFLPEILRETHLEWRYESLDGIYPVVARKAGKQNAEIFGECCLITDQALTPLHLQLQLDLIEDEVSWLELKIGELRDGKMVRRPYEQCGIRLSGSSPESIEWAYHVGFGTLRP